MTRILTRMPVKSSSLSADSPAQGGVGGFPDRMTAVENTAPSNVGMDIIINYIKIVTLC